MADTQKASSSKEDVFGVFRLGVYSKLNMGIAVGTFLKITMGHKHHGLETDLFFTLWGCFGVHISKLWIVYERFSWKLKIMISFIGFFLPKFISLALKGVYKMVINGVTGPLQMAF